MSQPTQVVPSRQNGMTDIQRIAFYDDELLAVTNEATGKEYVVPKPMVDMFELDWSGQRTKLMHHQLFKKGVEIITLPSAGGNQKTLLLERRLVHAWLLSLNPGKVAEHLRDKLARYQEECADVLDAHFTKSPLPVPQVKNPAIQMMIDLAVRLDATEQRAIAAEETAQHSKDLALQALHGQQWLTIRQYVAIHQLTRQLPVGQAQKDYGRWLTGYCKEKGLPVYENRSLEGWDEHTYAQWAMSQTLPGWLHRRSGQQPLRAIQPRALPDGKVSS